MAKSELLYPSRPNPSTVHDDANGHANNVGLQSDSIESLWSQLVQREQDALSAVGAPLAMRMRLVNDHEKLGELLDLRFQAMLQAQEASERKAADAKSMAF